MSTIQIGQDSRPLVDADQHWVTQSINGRRKDGLNVCVRISIKTDDLDFNLGTVACEGGGGGRAPYGREIPILELWRKHGLDRADFSTGAVVAFLQGLRRFL